MSSITKVFIGSIVHCDKPFSLAVLEKGFLIVTGSKIVALDNEEKLEETIKKLEIKNPEIIKLTKTQLLLPGLIDTHIHAPQYPNIGLGYDMPLLNWLEKYTYNLESQYKDLSFSKKVYDSIVQKTLSYGTTTACYFGSMFKDSTLTLVDSVIEHGQRALVGKINMTQLAPENYIETPEDSIRDTVSFIEEVRNKKNPLVKPIITPRFALSVNMEMMKRLGEIAEKYGCHIQTHISENLDEIKCVKEMYKIEYAQVYDEAKLLNNKCVLAHGVHLEDTELKLISEQGSSVAHCPTSNTRLASGMCDVKRIVENGINVGLGTDVSGGHSASIIEVMKAAVDTSIHLSFGKENYVPLNYVDAFYLATMGGAKALAMDDVIGNFEIGKEFDAILVDLDVEDSTAHLLTEVNCREMLQKFVFVGDDRNIKRVYVGGTDVSKSSTEKLTFVK